MNKKKVLGIIAAAAVIAALLLVYGIFREKPVAGAKHVTLEVENSAGETTAYEVDTDAEFLEQVMNEAEGLEFVTKEGPYGSSVVTVNGESADFENGDSAYWGFFINGEYCNYSITEQPVEDGDVFRIVYTEFE